MKEVVNLFLNIEHGIEAYYFIIIKSKYIAIKKSYLKTSKTYREK